MSCRAGGGHPCEVRTRCGEFPGSHLCLIDAIQGSDETTSRDRVCISVKENQDAIKKEMLKREEGASGPENRTAEHPKT